MARKNVWKGLEILILFGMCIFFIVRLFVQPVAMTASPTDTLLYQRFAANFGGQTIWIRLFLLVGAVLQLGFMQFFFLRNNFSESKSPLALVFFLVFSCFCVDSQAVTPAFFTILLTTILLNLNVNFLAERVKSQLILSGLLIALGSFLDISAVWLLLFVIISLLTNGFATPKNILLLLITFLFPYIWLFALFFFVGDLPLLTANFRQQLWFAPLSLNLTTPAVVFLSVTAFVSIFTLLKLKFHFDNKLIVLRKRLMSLNALFLVCLLIAICTQAAVRVGALYMFVPFAIVFSLLLQIRKSLIINYLLVAAWLTSFILMFHLNVPIQ